MRLLFPPYAGALPDRYHCVILGTSIGDPSPPICPAPTRRSQELGAVQQADFKLSKPDPDPANVILQISQTTSALGLWQGADAPLGSHPPCASQPCAPEADPVLRPEEGARGESVGHWIDAALADEGWWWAEEGAQSSICCGSFEDSDESVDPLLVGSDAEGR